MQEKYTKDIVIFWRENRRMPTFSEIMQLTGLKSKNAVFKLVNKLEDRGVVRRSGGGKLVPGKHLEQVKLLGLVEAGWPSPAEEETVDTMDLNEYLIDRPEATFLVKVKGDSMKDAGIVEGDMLLVEKGVEARDGDIVIAELDGEWTVKFLRKEKSVSFLEAANTRYKPMYPKMSLKVGAVVRAVVRKYG